MRQYTTYEFALFFLLLFLCVDLGVRVYNCIFCGNEIYYFTIEKTDCFMSLLNTTLKIVWNRKQESNTSKCKRLFFPVWFWLSHKEQCFYYDRQNALSSSLFLRMSTVGHHNSIVSFLNIISLDSVCKYKHTLNLSLSFRTSGDCWSPFFSQTLNASISFICCHMFQTGSER